MKIKGSHWITVSQSIGDAAPVFRRAFSLKKGAERATLEITALGVYEAKINGSPVGDFVLAPGWTSYDHRLQVQTYDLTPYLSENNTLSVTVGNGWYKGILGFYRGN